ncbi:oocyte zinc finger protein XlCOF6-like [Rhinatrema bivittatum]|uniref:oocyte zinc finger protein XlCOF6-like n=1 Tax=Rhinatrema bivittatum TaxID=194408 RepID=UPI00112D0D0F|nr:oocyte zinc finger protein XlCOF6-like [Rhinatrema bivittatum]
MCFPSSCSPFNLHAYPLGEKLQGEGRAVGFSFSPMLTMGNRKGKSPGAGRKGSAPSSVQPLAEPPGAGRALDPLQPRTLGSLWMVLVRLEATMSSKLERIQGEISSLELRSGTQEKEISAQAKRLQALENKVPVTFEDVAVSFSQEEWGYLDEGQKKLYREVMKENYETLSSLETGHHRVNPDVLLRIKQEEVPCVWDPQESGEREVTHSYTGTADIQDAEREENQEECPVVLLVPRKSETVRETVCQKTGEEESSQSHQESEKRDSAADLPNRVTACKKRDRELTDIPEHQQRGRGERPYQTNKSNHMTSDTCDGNEKRKKSFLYNTGGKNVDRKYLLLQQRAQMGRRSFPCSQCVKCFKQKLILKLHQRIHTKRKIFSCVECKKNFSRKESLVIHLRTHNDKRYFNYPEHCNFFLIQQQKMQTAERMFPSYEGGSKVIQKQDQRINQKTQFEKKKHTCTVCDKRFIYQSQLKRHQTNHMIEQQFKCTECDKSFISLSHLKKHQRTHGREKPFTGTEFNQSFTHSNLKRHQKSHRGEKSFVCTECNKCFTLSSSLKVHERIHKSEKRFICTECNKSFSQSYLKVHQRIHSGEKPFTCTECNKSFISSATLTVHKRIHSGEKPFTCTECTKSFTNWSALKTHKMIHTGEKPFTCTECKKSFTRHSSMKVHQRIHSGEKLFTCTECNKCFNQVSALKAHQRIHSGEKQFTCTECNKGFPQCSALKVHQRIHSGEKPFTCTECNKSFIQCSALKVHQRIHKGEKPFTCTECNKSFIQFNALQIHQRIHRGEKPYTCTECNKSFTQSTHLKLHQTIHTGEKPFMCPQCDKTFSRKSNLKKHLKIH